MLSLRHSVLNVVCASLRLNMVNNYCEIIWTSTSDRTSRRMRTSDVELPGAGLLAAKYASFANCTRVDDLYGLFVPELGVGCP